MTINTLIDLIELAGKSPSFKCMCVRSRQGGGERYRRKEAGTEGKRREGKRDGWGETERQGR